MGNEQATKNKTDDVVAMFDRYVLGTYKRAGLCLIRGEGMRVWDIEGGEYLDFFPGWAVSGLGHAPGGITDAIERQAKKIIHVANNFYNEPQGLLAKKIIEHGFPGKVFFCNSGAEANEAAIKFARKFGGGTRHEIITFSKSFHGRTFGAMAATGQDKIKEGFAPMLEGFKHVPFNDLTALEKSITEKTVAIMVEPIQGEGGINMLGKDFAAALGNICREKNILLICDEVQTGMGRTGAFYAYKHFDLKPDVMTLAKSLGNGFPIAATVVSDKVADAVAPGDHASTFGGSPLACAAALAVFAMIEDQNLLSNVAKMSRYLVQKINGLKAKHTLVRSVRGTGLMLGIELARAKSDRIAADCQALGLLVNSTQGNVIRLMPPLIVTEGDIDQALAILEKVLNRMDDAGGAA